MRGKIALIYNTSRYLYKLRREFIELLQLHDYDVVGIAPRDESTEALSGLGVKHIHFDISARGINPIRDFKTFRQLRKILRAEQPDVVLSYTVKPVMYGSYAAHLEGVKTICAMITGLGQLFNNESATQRLLLAAVAPFYRKSLDVCRRVYFQNSDDAQLLQSLKIANAEQTVVLPGSGVDVQRFRPKPEAVQPGSFLLIARMLKEKGSADFVAAARLLQSSYPHATFRLLGPLEQGPSAHTQSEIQDWQASGFIEYLGEIEDVRPFLTSSEVFVLPSYYREGLPRSILEAMACGKPIVTTDWPGCREAVAEGVNGFLVPVRNPQRLAAAMEKFLTDASLSGSMGEKSRQLALDRFDVRKVNAQILATMADVDH